MLNLSYEVNNSNEKNKGVTDFWKQEKLLIPKKAREVNTCKESRKKDQFFLIRISRIFNFPVFIVFLVFQLFSAFLSFFQLFSAFFSFFQLFSAHISQISYFFRSFHHKFLQSLLLLDKFSYNIGTHTNLSLEKRHGTKNSTWIFAEIYRQFWTRKSCTRLGSGASYGIYWSSTSGISSNYASNL